MLFCPVAIAICIIKWPQITADFDIRQQTLKMQQNYRELPPLPRNRNPEMSGRNRFEDENNPVRLVQTSTEKWIDQAKDFGNKTDAINKQFSQRMQQVRRRTEQEFSMGSQNRSRSQNYLGGQKNMNEHKRRHLHLYSNKKVNNGIYSTRFTNSAQFTRPTTDKPTKQDPYQQENVEEAEAGKQLVQQRRITKTIRYLNDNNEEVEEKDEIDYKIVGKGAFRQDLPKMSDALRLQQGETPGRDGERQQFKGIKKRQNQSIFKRLHDKAQNVYSGLNAESNGAAIPEHDDEADYRPNFKAVIPVGDTNYEAQQVFEESSTPRKNPSQVQQSPQYYQPEGQRIIDEKLEEIRRRNRAIQAQIQKRTQGMDSQTNFNRDSPASRENEMNFNASPIRGQQQPKGINLTQQQQQQMAMGGVADSNSDFLDLFKGRGGGNEMGEMNDSQIKPTNRTPLSQAPLKPASGIMVTQGPPSVPAPQKRSDGPAGQGNFQSPDVLQRFQGQGKQLGEMIDREATRKQVPEVLNRLQSQGKQLNQMIMRETSQYQQQELPQAMKKLQSHGKELNDMIDRQAQLQTPDVLQRLQGHGKELSEMISRQAQQQPPEILSRLQGHGKDLTEMINRQTQSKRPPEVTQGLQSNLPELLQRMQGKPLNDFINKQIAGNRFSSELPPGIQGLQNKPMSNLVNQQATRFQSQPPPGYQYPQGQLPMQVPQILQPLQGKALVDLINRETAPGQQKMPQMISTRFKSQPSQQQPKNNIGNLGADSGEEFQDSDEDSPPLYSNKAVNKKQQAEAQRTLDEKMIEIQKKGPQLQEMVNQNYDAASYKQNPVLQKFEGKGKQLQDMISREVEEQNRKSLEDLGGSIIDGVNLPSLINNMSPSENAKFAHTQFQPFPGIPPNQRPPMMNAQPLPPKPPGQFGSLPPGIGMPTTGGPPRTNALMGGQNFVNPNSVHSQSMSPIRGSGTQMPQPIYYSPPSDAISRPGGGSRIVGQPPPSTTQKPNPPPYEPLKRSGVLEGSGYMMLPHNPSMLGHIPGSGLPPPPQGGSYTVKTITPTGPPVMISTTAPGGITGSRAGGIAPPAMPNSAVPQSAIPPSLTPSQHPWSGSAPPSSIPPGVLLSSVPPPSPPSSNIPFNAMPLSPYSNTAPITIPPPPPHALPSQVSFPTSQFGPGQLHSQSFGNSQMMLGPGAGQTNLHTSQMGIVRTSQIGTPFPALIEQEMVHTERQLMPGSATATFVPNSQIVGSRVLMPAVMQTSGLPTVVVTPTEIPQIPPPKKHWYSKCTKCCTIF